MAKQAGEKSYQCNQCDFASAQAGNLGRHLKTHSGEKPFKCNQCEYASANAGNLGKHFKTHSERNQTNVTSVAIPQFRQAI